MEADTASLRAAAPQWSLAGDKQLLDILHNIHQSLVSRCQEVNRKLDEMVLALDGASIDLQNVNNKFMALSNSQFIESRVFDDDADVAAQEPPKEVPRPEPPTQDLEKLKQSIRALESAHEVIEIIDSDSDESDDEELTRTVLKMRDAYAHRPLPHVIGSQAWRAKWHAGLQLSGSESDSGSAAARDQYSDSEPDAGDDGQGPAHAQPDVEGSSGSSEFPSEQESRVGSLARSPADVAAELARRLGGVPPKIPAQETEYSPPPAMTQKVYRPDQPSAGTVFCDEPPPLEQCQSEEEAEEEDDIFAELRRDSRRGLGSAAPGAADELFGRGDAGGDIFSDFRDDKVTSTPTTKKSTLFEDESEPELFADRPPRQDTAPHERQPARPDADAVKKPVGGISLFGNNKGAESIGAAILKRNQRQQSSEDDSDVSPPTKEDSPPKTREKDIFDDLFAKSEREQKMKEKLKEPPKETPKAKVDLFSDNIFDDIDDIFTSNISTVIKKENKNDKPLFDDDDDLFSDIAVSKSTSVAKDSGKEKSIFDSDDDLFSETVKKHESVVPKSNVVASNKLDHVEDIFADIVDKGSGAQANVINVAAEEITRTKVGVSNKNDVPNNDHSKSNESSVHKSSLNNKELPKSSKENSFNTGGPNNNMEKPMNSLFGDEEDDELFAQDTKKISASDENSNIVNKSKTLKSHDNLSKGLQKSSLFDDDSDESDLFGSSTNKNQVKKENNDVLQKSASNIKSHNNKESLNFSQKAPLFDDDETEDIFAATSKNRDITVTKPTGTDTASQMTHAVVDDDKTRSLFEDDVDDSDIFGNIATKSTVKPDSLSSIKEHKRTVFRQEVSESNQRDEKPSIENQKLSHSAQNVSAQEPVLHEKLEVKNENSLPKEQKPTVNELKPKLQQKSDIKQEKPSTMEHRPNKVPTEPVANILKDDVTSETKTVDSKGPITKDEINKLSPTKEELFAKQESHTKTDVLDEPTEYKIPDLDELDKENSFDAKDSILQPKDSLFNSPAVFDDIFSEPPAFEKSAEPKKSKNVNALFDDDSDDEALFFKKNDVLLDDKPDLSPDANKDALFGIFHDEPPAMDVDFTQKASSSNLNDDFLKTDSDDDMFTIKSKKDVSQSSQKYLVAEDGTKAADDISKSTAENKEITMKSSPVLDKTNKLEQQTKTDNKGTTDSDTKKVGKLKTMNFNIDVSTLLPGASPKKKAVEQTDGQVISINKQDNMHTASESIQKTLPDTQALSTKSHEDLHASDKRERVEHSVFKSVSFDGEPDSNILDNKLSKERAKIQVKRRPSTRRARKEAVRKSAIDIADDSTDNSSSIDDPPRLPKPQSRDNDHQPSKESKSEPTFTITIPIETNTRTRTDAEINKQKITTESPPVRTNENTTSEIESKNGTMAESIHVIDPNIIRNGNENESTDTKTSQIDIVEQSIDTPDSNQSQYVDSRLESIPQSIQNTNPDPELKRTDNKNVTSKVVYILNDEDIFTNPTIENPQKSKVLNIVDDDDDLFRNVPKSSGISTLGNAYKDIASDIEREVKSTIANNANIDSSSIFENVAPRHSKSHVKTDDSKNVDRKPKQSLFGDLSDDENDLFKNKKPSKVKSILDSDSEDDLFGATRKRDAREGRAASAGDASVKPRPEVKSSLFGDDDDDDDLFGVKVKSNVAATSQPARPTKEMVSKTPEPVFDDPLSLLGADDD